MTEDRRVLPVVGGPRPERADAVRNRRRILAAARRVIAARGVEGLSLDDVAREAGVGVGTVYRRFGGRSRLLYALIDEREREFQSAFMHGPAPLGPGDGDAAPAARVRAFLHALADRTEEQSELLLTAESDTPFARFRDAYYDLYRLHLTGLIERIRPSDAEYLADALLAPLAANLFRYQRHARGMDVARIKAGLDDLLAGVIHPQEGVMREAGPRPH
ncbi:TetR/AcrR family transcriptional regulator [Actinomadura sp. WMMB 499]|uniref:TetR/AcrR family transcriptional regulator n=1 Tax=Actinomadura sp. WMMB 499 TaxID=1219491 RepID=UPI00159E27E7|nr:TetR/AcrR family transcriptional regulator [Actinomadura sp. WMMB 499]